ncbi:class A beta-lactamase-related serine hydrolase [Devosia sp. ZB163]|uniref:serine hydrolase n=1 Tax=Devosia sp. ZB163 TaxID=3025938 RepID=UPI00235E8A12|nr:serine hydrolase [Devosia sp. ZB163]MDC9822775.1 class A beta-lactamase-related serine hydrolase [Devosia sp. ZB163]
MSQSTAIAERYPHPLSFIGKNLGTGKTIAFAPRKLMPTASCIKLPMLVALYDKAERGEIDLNEMITMQPIDQIGGSGVLKHLTGGLTLSLRDVATLMIVLSDNTATNIIADRVGIDFINATMAELGLSSTTLKTRIDFGAIGNEVRNLAESTVADFAILLEGIAKGRLISPKASAAIKDIMSRQHYLDLLPRYLPANPYARDLGTETDLAVAGKTGFFPGFRADTIIVDANGQTLVMAAFVYGDDQSFLADNAIATFMGGLGQALFHELTN